MALRLAPIALSTLSTISRPFAPELSARLGRSASKRETGGRRTATPDDELRRRYDALVAHWEGERASRRRMLERKLAESGHAPSFSVLFPAWHGPDLPASVSAVLSQSYGTFEVIVAGSSAEDLCPPMSDERLKFVDATATESEGDPAGIALSMARGDYVVPLLPGDVLDPDALLNFAARIAQDDGGLVIYADHDTIDAAGRRSDPVFKPDWNRELLHGFDYISRPVALKRSHALARGGFRSDEDPIYGLVLRCTADATSEVVAHIPLVLAHRDGTADAARSGAFDGPGKAGALARSLREAVGTAIAVDFDERSRATVVRWPLPETPPKVSIIIPTRDGLELLERAVTSILGKTTYPDYEIVIVDNGSTEAATLDWLSGLSARDGRIHVLRDDGPFNFSALNNRAADLASGEVLALVNNDIEVISPDWLSEAVALALRPDVGCVGAKLFYPDDTIQHAGIILGMRRVAGHAFRGLPADAAGYCGRLRVRQEVTAVTAACLVVRREVFEEVGGLDEDRFPVAYNDVDFCLKVKARGYRNIWTPFAELVHHESVSRGSDRSGQGRRRLKDEAQRISEKWNLERFDDPAYNPNLTRESEDFAIASLHEIAGREP